MVNSKRSLFVGGFGAILLCAGFAARAQESGNSSGAIGPPQLKDFSLNPRERLVTQPAPPPVQVAPPSPAPAERRAERPAPPPEAGPAARREPAAQAPAATAQGEAPAPLPVVPLDSAQSPAPAAEPPVPEEPAAAPVAEQGWGFSYFYLGLPAAALALLGLVAIRRRRRGRAIAEAVAESAAPAAAVPAPPPRPRPDPVPRPWLELELKAERCAFTSAEAELQFELEIANKGGSPARNLRIDVKMFNAGAEQDREIGAFFRTAGRETTKLNLPAVEAGVVGVIHGSVRLPVDEMKALKLDERLLFIPVVAVNALYDWGEGRTGQTSKSYVVGREPEQPGAKMGAFRVDQGPRIWRTVGQRQHNLAKRV